MIQLIVTKKMLRMKMILYNIWQGMLQSFDDYCVIYRSNSNLLQRGYLNGSHETMNINLITDNKLYCFMQFQYPNEILRAMVEIMEQKFPRIEEFLDTNSDKSSIKEEYQRVGEDYYRYFDRGYGSAKLIDGTDFVLNMIHSGLTFTTSVKLDDVKKVMESVSIYQDSKKF